ncbi:WS/DGAT domain-containing protein, partial [Pyxidicoccus sp. 3LFB2]
SRWVRGARVAAKAARTVLRKGAELAEEPILAGDLVRQGARGLAAMGKLLVIPQDPHTPLRGPLGNEKRAAWSDPVPLEQVKAVGRTLGGTVNDVLLAAVTGALRRYLESRGVAPEDLHALVPVNLRPLDEPVPRELGNRFGVVFLRLPVHISNPRRRLLELAKRMGQVKRSPEAVLTFGALEMLGYAPAPIERTMVDAFGSKATLVATNVPGPREAVSVAGTKLGGLTFWVPQAGHLGLGVSLFSYAGQVTVGVAADAGRMPDPHALIRAFHDEMEALAGLTATD